MISDTHTHTHSIQSNLATSALMFRGMFWVARFGSHSEQLLHPHKGETLPRFPGQRVGEKLPAASHNNQSDTHRSSPQPSHPLNRRESQRDSSLDYGVEEETLDCVSSSSGVKLDQLLIDCTGREDERDTQTV